MGLPIGIWGIGFDVILGGLYIHLESRAQRKDVIFFGSSEIRAPGHDQNTTRGTHEFKGEGFFHLGPSERLLDEVGDGFEIIPNGIV